MHVYLKGPRSAHICLQMQGYLQACVNVHSVFSHACIQQTGIDIVNMRRRAHNLNVLHRGMQIGVEPMGVERSF